MDFGQIRKSLLDDAKRRVLLGEEHAGKATPDLLAYLAGGTGFAAAAPVVDHKLKQKGK